MIEIKREEMISQLIGFCQKKAEEFGLDTFAKSEDRQKGFWGESMTKHLEKIHEGDCSSDLIWINKSDINRFIKFRFRFSSPVISFQWRNEEGDLCLVSYEFHGSKFVESGRFYEEDGVFCKKGDPIKEEVAAPWKISESQIFTPHDTIEVYGQWLAELSVLVDGVNEKE